MAEEGVGGASTWGRGKEDGGHDEDEDDIEGEEELQEEAREEGEEGEEDEDLEPVLEHVEVRESGHGGLGLFALKDFGGGSPAPAACRRLRTWRSL